MDSTLYISEYQIHSHIISYSLRCLPRKGEKVTAEKVILNNVSGIVKPGQFMAIMGAR